MVLTSLTTPLTWRPSSRIVTVAIPEHCTADCRTSLEQTRLGREDRRTVARGLWKHHGSGRPQQSATGARSPKTQVLDFRGNRAKAQ